MKAPLVVAGTVRNVKILQEGMASQILKGRFVDFIRVSVDVHHVIKGAAQANQIEFYSYSYSPINSWGLGPLPFQPEVGHTALFFLTRQNQMLRNFVDVVNASIRIRSGTHPHIAPAWDDTPSRRLAWLLLTPGKGYNIEPFVSRLAWYSYYAEMLLPWPDILQLLEPLTKSSDVRIADEAAIYLSSLKEDGPQGLTLKVARENTGNPCIE